MTKYVAALLLAAAMLASCAHRQPPAGTGRALIIALQEEPDSLNPALANLAVSNDPIALIYDGLVKFDGDGKIVPDLAVSVPSKANGGISADGRTITYRLRHHVRWQDGAPFTSRDVRFTWRMLVDKRNNVPAAAGYDQIAGVRTPDPYTVELLLRRPYAPALSLFRNSKQGAILPEHLLARERDLNRSAFDGSPVGTGPYRLVRWRRGDRLEFAANPYYWQRPHFARVSLQLFPDEGSASNALLAGDVDAILGVHPSQLARLRGANGVLLESRPTFHWEHVAFNLRPGSGPQSNVHVRRAIAYALDIGRLDRAVLHQDLENAPLDQGPLSWARDSGVAYYPRDLERARRELLASGYRQVSLTIMSTSDSAVRRQLEVQMQQMLHDAGIGLVIKNVSATLLLSRQTRGGTLFSGNFELALFSYETPVPDPDDERYVATSAIPPNGLNVARYRNAGIDRLVALGQSTYDTGRRRAIYAAVQRRLIADLPFYTLAWTPETVAYRTSIIGVAPAPVGSDLWNIAAWGERRRPYANK